MTDEFNELLWKYANYEGKVLGDHKKFSVMVPFIDMEEGPVILFEVRSDSVDQPGEVCFPGGHVEKGESPMQAAIRETVEELGLEEEGYRNPAILKGFSIGDKVYGPGFTLYSNLCELDQSAVEASTPNPEEVSYTFLVPVKRLLELEPEVYHEGMKAEIEEGFPYEKVGIDKDYPWRVAETEIYVYYVDDHVIWGLTAKILKGVLDHLNGLDEEKDNMKDELG